MSDSDRFYMCPACGTHGNFVCTDGDEFQCPSRNTARAVLSIALNENDITPAEAEAVLEQIEACTLPEESDEPVVYIEAEMLEKDEAEMMGLAEDDETEEEDKEEPPPPPRPRLN